MEASLAVPALERESARPPLARDFLCGGCCYGIAPRATLPELCPMCGASAWIPLLAAKPAERATRPAGWATRAP